MILLSFIGQVGKSVKRIKKSEEKGQEETSEIVIDLLEPNGDFNSWGQASQWQEMENEAQRTGTTVSLLLNLDP